MGKLVEGAILSVLLSACTGGASSEPDSSGNPVDGAVGRVAGPWRFGFYTDMRDDYSTYQLDQNGSDVTGQHCSTQQDCDGGMCVVKGVTCGASSIAGTFIDSTLKLDWQFEEDAALYRVTTELTLSVDGQKMAGSGSSTKCGCQFTLRAARVIIGEKLPVP